MNVERRQIDPDYYDYVVTTGGGEEIVTPSDVVDEVSAYCTCDDGEPLNYLGRGGKEGDFRGCEHITAVKNEYGDDL